MYKKSLGQNFLTSTNIAKDIVGFGKLSKKDTVLEIGPGQGMLTQFLLLSEAKVIAVEKDNELFSGLKERFKKEIKSKQLILVNEDILKFDPKNYKLKALPAGRQVFSYKLVANIPYNITGQIIRKFLTAKHQPEQMTLMIQKEVGERIVAKSASGRSKESVLSLSVKAYGEPKIVKNVSKRHFLPQPKIDSVVINIDNISRKRFTKIDEKTFFIAVKSGFAHKRKKLIKNLEESFPKNALEDAFCSLDLSTNTRAEDLSLEKWLQLAKLIK